MICTIQLEDKQDLFNLTEMIKDESFTDLVEMKMLWYLRGILDEKMAQTQLQPTGS